MRVPRSRPVPTSLWGVVGMVCMLSACSGPSSASSASGAAPASATAGPGPSATAAPVHDLVGFRPTCGTVEQGLGQGTTPTDTARKRAVATCFVAALAACRPASARYDVAGVDNHLVNDLEVGPGRPCVVLDHQVNWLNNSRPPEVVEGSCRSAEVHGADLVLLTCSSDSPQIFGNRTL